MSESTAPAPEFYSDDSGRRRWWDGRAWADDDAGDGSRGRGGRLSDTERRAILDRAVARYVQNGYRVQSNSGRRAVVAKRQRVYVLPNLLLALVTGGLWLVVLAIRLLNWPTDRATLTVTDSGELLGEFAS